MATTITGTLPAYSYVKGFHLDPSRIASAAAESQAHKDELLSRLTITNGQWAKSDGDYIPVGTVEITFTPLDTGAMVRGQVEALQAQAAKVRAEAHRECVRIEDQISKLQALTFDPQ